jgi:hypothetical protein
MRLVTAAEQLLKLADTLEAEAQKITVFACADCGHSKSLQEINATIKKYAASEKIASDDLIVHVNDTIKCAACESGTMSYMPTEGSARYYVNAAEMEDEATEGDKSEETQPAEGQEVLAGLDLKTVTKQVAGLGKDAVKQLAAEMKKIMQQAPAADPHIKDKYTGVDLSVDEEQRAYEEELKKKALEGERLLKNLKLASDEEDGETKEAGMMKNIPAVAALLLSLMTAESRAEKPQDRMKELNKMFEQVMENIQTEEHKLEEYQAKGYDKDGNPTHVRVSPEDGKKDTVAVKDYSDWKNASLVKQDKLSRYLA